MSTIQFTPEQFYGMINSGEWRNIYLSYIRALNDGTVTPAKFEEFIKYGSGGACSPIYSKSGKVIGYNYGRVTETTTVNTLNSNASNVARTKISSPIATTVGEGVVKSGKIAPPSMWPSATTYAVSSIGNAALAAGVGITVGKTFDSALYNANPDFFDSIGMSTLNPETWGMITRDVDAFNNPLLSASAEAFNLIFGINPESNEMQAYVDENAFAYMASWLQSQGAFDTGGKTSPDVPGIDLYSVDAGIVTGIHKQSTVGNTIRWGSTNSEKIDDRANASVPMFASEDSSEWVYSFSSSKPFYLKSLSTRTGTVDVTSSIERTYNGKHVYYENARYYKANIATVEPILPFEDYSAVNLAYYYVNAYGESSTVIDGIGTQTGATTPQNLTGNPTTDLPLLRQQYPDLWDDSLQYPVVQPDGTIDNHTYIPVALPFGNGNTDLQPTSGTQTQQSLKIKVDELPQELQQMVQQILNAPVEEPFNVDNPPANPSDTGEGSTPTPIAPTGSASALWSIYHPLQSEIDAFGAWLWSPSFIDQLAKIFNDPMQSIIGLHKVYATPVDAGTSTIAVGYLDSGVSSAYITQQYVTVDCGTVDVYETFGNVFDYAPYTDVKLYLPFVGIVSLDVADVMRGSLHISYEVDVLTGACLAVVTVNRDGNSAVMYQYAGNCAVQYPLSSGSYMGIVSSIIGVAGTVAATIATGGSVAPLAIGAAGAAMSAHTTVQNSGSFSGNAGAMGGKKPYLIIKRPQSKMADGQESYIGTPTNYNSVVGDYSGYIRASSVHLEGVTATDTELDMIQTLLEGGILA